MYVLPLNVRSGVVACFLVGVWRPMPPQARAPKVIVQGDAQPRLTAALRVDSAWTRRGVLVGQGMLGSWVDVRVANLPDAMAAGLDPATLVLYLDGYPLKGTSGVLVNPTLGDLEFELRRTVDNKDTWRTLYRRIGIPADTTTVRVGVGSLKEGEVPAADSKRPRVHLVIVNVPLLTLSIVLVLSLLFLIIWLGATTGLLREAPRPTDPPQRNTPPPPIPGPEPPTLPFSLGRTQMAFWFFLVVAAFLFIWVATLDYNSILTDQALALIGIGTSTALGSAAVVALKRESARQRIIALSEQAAKIAALMATGGAGAAALRAAELEIDAAIVAARKNMGKSGHTTFWEDILSDASGVALYRFQLVVWTVVLGLVFVFEVVTYLAMPQFNATLLALLGVSGGTYLGFNIPAVPK